MLINDSFKTKVISLFKLFIVVLIILIYQNKRKLMKRYNLNRISNLRVQKCLPKSAPPQKHDYVSIVKLRSKLKSKQHGMVDHTNIIADVFVKIDLKY
jgi:hypothetical protein